MKRFFIAFAEKLLVMTETETGYEVSEHLHEMAPSHLAFDLENEQRIYCGTKKNGLWRSENGRATWEKLKLDFKCVTSVAINPLTSEIYAGTEPSHLFVSKDYGETWAEFTVIQDLPSKKNWRFPPRPETHYVRWITPSYSNENHLALSIEAGAIINSYDGGETWVDRVEDSPIDTHTLLAHPKAPGRLYAANGDGGSNPKKAYAESYDEGRSWKYMSEGIEEHPYLYNMLLHSENPDDRLVSASKNAGAAHRSPRYSTVYRKIGEADWTEISDGLPRTNAYTHHLAEDPNKAGAFYAFNNFGIYYLDEDENKWERVEIPELEAYLGKRAYHFVIK